MLKPRARSEGLIVQELDDEVLVYDTARAKAHCLNRTAALVWRACDGETPVTEMARRLRDLRAPDLGAETLVLEALRRLQKAHLLEGTAVLPKPATGGSRREALRSLVRMAGAASVPLVATIVAPHAAEAASCVPLSEACTRSSQCCPNNQSVRCCRNGECAQGLGNCAPG